MKEKFTLALENLKKELILMANEVENALFQALRAFELQDRTAADKVFEIDRNIDEQEVRLEEEMLSLLALFQPVAADLRFIVGALKMNNDLERIGDHSLNIARTVIKILREPYLKSIDDMYKMGQIVRSMLHDAVHSFINQDTELAKKVCETDDQVDDLNYAIQAELLQVLQQKPEKISQGLDLIYIARNLERIADLSTNLSEEVIFMRDAKIIRHRLS
jgi:phosphate transport system protein